MIQHFCIQFHFGPWVVYYDVVETHREGERAMMMQAAAAEAATATKRASLASSGVFAAVT